MKRLLTTTSLILVSLVVIFWASVHLWVPGLIRDQAAKFAEQVGYQIEVGDVDITPLLLRMRLSDLRFATPQGEALFELKQLELDIRFLPLLAGRLSLEHIRLDSPVVMVARPRKMTAQDAPWNWSVFVDQLSRLNSPSTENDPDAHAGFRIDVDELKVRDARIAVRDGVSDLAYDIGPFSLDLLALSNQDDAGHVGGSSLQSGVVFNLGALKIPLPKIDGVPDRHLVFNRVSASGHVNGNSESVIKAGLDLRLDDEIIQSSWVLDSNGILRGEVSFAALTIKPWLVLLPTQQALDSRSGVMRASITLQQDASGFVLNGGLSVDQLDLRVKDAEEPLLAWAAVSMQKIQLRMPNDIAQPRQVFISDIVVDDPKVRLVIDTERQSNFQRLFNQSESGNPPTPGLRYDIRSVRLKNGQMYFADESIKPAFRVDVTDLNGSVQGVSNEAGRYASLELAGRAAQTGSLRARGQLALADPRQNNEVSLVFRHIPLSTTNPYLMTFAGYAVEDGRLDVDLRYTTQAGRLEGKNRFVIKKIKLGEPVPDYPGSRLPLGLAIALLEDADGMIDVNIPVNGNVNEPEFSVGHLVWQAVQTLLTNVATAPFRALGALLGIDNTEAIAFIPGESTLPPDGDALLSKLAELLAGRPKALLVIHGSYDPAVDAAELARAKANMVERDPRLREALIQSEGIGDEQLKALAMRRADALKAKLLSVNPALAERVSIGEPESVTAEQTGVPIRVDLVAGSP